MKNDKMKPADVSAFFASMDLAEAERAILAKYAPAGTDIHTLRAAIENKIPPEEVTPEQRRAAKSLNYLTAYSNDDYSKYRGKCKEMSEALVAADPTLRLVRGHYFCFAWGEQPHWWCQRPDGTIVDPTKDQFPSKGNGTYVEFDGKIACSECGKETTEDEAIIHGNYAFCSGECNQRFVGL